MRKIFLLSSIASISILSCFAQIKSSLATLPIQEGIPNGLRCYDSCKSDEGFTMLDFFGDYSLLVDMKGNVLEKFPLGYVNVLEDGDLIGKAGDSDLVRTDPDLNIIWKTPVNFEIHHEITVDDSDNIYLLSTHMHSFLNQDIEFAVIEKYSALGKKLYEWCVFDHLSEFLSVVSRSAWVSDLPLSYAQSKSAEQYVSQDLEKFLSPSIDEKRHHPYGFEFTHFNSIQVLPDNEVFKKIPAFAKGNLLLSFNPYSCYGILNMSSSKIEWVGYLPERTTLHTPKLTPQGTILIYQNSTDSLGWTSRPEYSAWRDRFPMIEQYPDRIKCRARLWNSISEYDPVSNTKVWEYTATPKESMKCWGLGSAQRLPNGNTLICSPSEDHGGRIFSVTREKEIVWDYVYPEKDRETGQPLLFYRARSINASLGKKIFLPSARPGQ
jgi:hypothetical protein